MLTNGDQNADEYRSECSRIWLTQNADEYRSACERDVGSRDKVYSAAVRCIHGMKNAQLQTRHNSYPQTQGILFTGDV